MREKEERRETYRGSTCARFVGVVGAVALHGSSCGACMHKKERKKER